VFESEKFMSLCVDDTNIIIMVLGHFAETDIELAKEHYVCHCHLMI